MTGDVDNAPAGTALDRRSIFVQLPAGTDVTSLIPWFTFSDGVTNVQVGSTVVHSGQTALNFTWTIVFMVDNQFGTSEYSVTVVPEGGNASCEITRFKLPVLGAGTINTNVTPHEIIFTNVPYEMDVSNLKPTVYLSYNGATLTPSATNAYNFATNNLFTVTAANGTDSRQYVVKLFKAVASSEKKITRFWVQGLKPGFPVVDSSSNTVYAILYNGYSVTALAPDIEVSDHATVSPASGTVQDFSSPVTYTVTAQDGTTAQWTVTVIEAPSSDKDMVWLTFPKVLNTALPFDIQLGWDYYNKRFTNNAWPNGLASSSLIAAFSNTGVAVTVSGVTQQSGVTVNDFSGNSVQYVVHAADGTSNVFPVYLSSAYAMDMVLFGFYATNNSGLGGDYPCTINGRNITVTLPLGTDRAALVPAFVHTGSGVKVGTAVQTSGVDSQDFTSPVTYKVQAGNVAYSREYTVTVDVVKSTENRVTNISIGKTVYSVTVNDTTNGIDIVVPDGTDLSSCAMTIHTTSIAGGYPVTVNGSVYYEGMTVNLNNPATVSVRAENDDVRTYTLLAHESVLPRAFTAFTVASSNGTINTETRTVEVTVSNGTPLSAAVPQFAVTAGITNVTVGGVAQTSGTTAVDFSSPVIYTLWAQDGSSVTWQVTVTEASAVVTVPEGLYIWEYNQGSGNEFVELWNNTGSSITLGIDFMGSKSVNYFLLFIDGADGTVYGATPLYGGIDSGNVTYFGAAAGASHPLGVTLQSGPDAVLLVSSGSGVNPDSQASWIGVDVGTAATFTHDGTEYTKISALPYGTSGGTVPDQALLDRCLGYTGYAVTPSSGSLQYLGNQQWKTNSSPTPGFK